ncbi:hypothetical protein FACS1894190_05330 [Spirochaetia bacterium]|nr:hypothetical protein FACS1894190_05330 [Spirochaetia bacterium]
MLQFSTKAETLKQLEQSLTRGKVLPQVSFTIDKLLSEPLAVKQEVISKFGAQRLIVRSSALAEDTGTESQAGKYVSVLDVLPENILDAAKEVAESFCDGNKKNQILVQPMLTDIQLSGVVFTLDPNTGGNYFVINYDTSGSSTLVTSGGGGGHLSTCYVFHGKTSEDGRINKVLDAAVEIMNLFNKKNIDIEFALTHNGELFILQARPLIMRVEQADFQRQSAAMERTYQFISRSIGMHPYLKGKRAIYGVMPDWNPAEMIGLRPTRLASSLYRKLITDGTWAYQRDEYGYRNLRSFPLMLDFCGLPYIDVRVSFNSFIPKQIDDTLSDKLANYYLDSLAQSPEKHDKVEFDIVFSCNTFDLSNRITVLSNHGFIKEEQDLLKESLRKLTNNIINVKDGLWITDTKKIEILDERREIIINSDLDIIPKIYWLLADCTRYGTLPFAGLARGGFVAVQMLKSLVSIGILTEQDYQNYLGGLQTISFQISEDWQNLSKTAFLKKYGHLRPGTYNIMSPRYDFSPETYFDEKSQYSDYMVKEKNPFLLSLKQYSDIQKEMEIQNFDGDVLTLFSFFKAAIEGREYSKFVFTKSLSYVLELFAELGETHGICREDMSYVECFIIDKLYSSSMDVKETLVKSIEEGKKYHAETMTFTMPPVIMSPDDIYSFYMPSGAPNFITLKEITGELYSGALERDAIAKKILLIPAADPGYDWIFSCNILGFITAYGGANSHMAIRANELGLPAIIGIGQKEFDRLSHVKKIHIDCANKKFEVL